MRIANVSSDSVESNATQTPAVASFEGLYILFFSLTYPPEEVGTAPYAGGVAEHLARLGAKVRVVTGMPHYPGWRIWDGYRGRWLMYEQRNGVEVVRVRNFIPARQSATRRLAYEASFFLCGSFFTGGERPAAVLGVIPSLSGGFLARVAAMRHRVPFGVIVQDMTGAAAAQSGIPGGLAVSKATEWIERQIIANADGVAAVSEAFIPRLCQLGVDAAQISLVRNWSRMPQPSRRKPDVRAELAWHPDETIVLHAGNIGHKQALDQIVDAAYLSVNRFRNVKFVIMGDGSQRGHLEEKARCLRNVEFLSPRYGQEFADVLGAADILLVNERPSVLDMSLPSKLTSYFVAGRPILACVAPAGATAQEVERSEAGVVVPSGDAEALIKGIVALSENAGQMDLLSRGGPAYAAAVLSQKASLNMASQFVSRLMGLV